MSRWCGLLALFAAGLPAQQMAPVGIVRGTFLESDASGEMGQFSLRTANNSVYRFLFDDKTYVERMQQRATIAALVVGEPLEVVSDRGRGPRLRYARIVRVVETDPFEGRRRPRLFGSYRAPTEDIIPRGSVAYAGIVLRCDSRSVTLRTRSRELKRIVLRPDTRFVRDGLIVDRTSLGVNTRVFVRAGESFERETEAYDMMWGEILKPGP